MREAGYLAPELMSHRPTSDAYKSSVDIWGFGMIVFELLTGKVLRSISTSPKIATDKIQTYSVVLMASLPLSSITKTAWFPILSMMP